MKIDVGTYVRISALYSGDKALINQTGNVEALPNSEHPNDYLIKLDGGINSNPRFAGRVIRVPAIYLELVDQIHRIW
jgi:hypothetical protein